ncbi:hypothetical protein ACIRQF_34475 [Streptomyces sp. NPDC101191]|uniref:hypothetical protein n=1 Tax=Streptomyces sp. NPDC101191 TaxID=3366126 RepID=UPI0037F73114
MHADIHLTLHRLTAAELQEAAAVAAPTTPVRVRLGWRLVECGLRLAVPRPAAARTAIHAAV